MYVLTLLHYYYIGIMIELEGQLDDDGRLTTCTRNEQGVREDRMDLWRARENMERWCDGGREAHSERGGREGGRERKGVLEVEERTAVTW